MLPWQDPRQPEPKKKRIALWVMLGLAAIVVFGVAVYATVATFNKDQAAHSYTQPATHNQAELADLKNEYVGEAHNQTGGPRAKGTLRIVFKDKTATALKGSVEVGGPYLGGTGEFYDGTYSNGVVTLTIHPTDGIYTSYTLKGTLGSDGVLQGSLSVPATAHTVAQSGTWKVSPVR
ncbi:MAG TPA: hypothetical protein VFO38_00610 [Candidatus Saccharimonadales bacterium]|nr:hypothetical protein [Candidatus Saccharimonadales bacterium]